MVLDGGKAPTRCKTLSVETQLFLASKAVIFVDFTISQVLIFDSGKLQNSPHIGVANRSRERSRPGLSS